MLNIELIYATPEQQELITLSIESGATIEQAINQSGVLIQFPDIDLSKNKVGIFSQVKPLDYVLKNGDRIEIYRPLIADPKAKRREKALKNQEQKNN
ncbi:RnfH family protein [Marinicella gelatinilytica]|uniref:RnfH family protein n=1 Tax=Marinicella gelatinilytica TaxID=2996017 RepID=UPI002260DA77|nr:RnfH family protein [Marinicella gelatinilytica]MCX7544577.1 RnfH family protein [Marinicella gelatinilytica]